MRKIITYTLVTVTIFTTHLLYAREKHSDTNAINVYFSPYGGAKRAIIEELSSAKQKVHIAMFFLTSSKISAELIRTSKRGVKVVIILDESKAKEYLTQKQIEAFEKCGITLLYKSFNIKSKSTKTIQPLFHHKFAIIDSRTVITGSYNWTATAEIKNYEDLLIIRNVSVAKQYTKRFDEIVYSISETEQTTSTNAREDAKGRRKDDNKGK